MSGPGTPTGPSNAPSLVTEGIPHGADGQTTMSVDTFSEMYPDPLPGRILRMQRYKNAGTIGENSLDGANPDFGRGYIPHQYIPRHPVSVTPFDKTIDPTVTIPAIFIGDPLH